MTTPLPALLATTGSISLSRRAINKKIGELFILRINIHLQGSVLDSPELMWAEPRLEPVYGAVRSYLEMDQRVGLLMERLGVLSDLLAVLKDQVRTSHGEALEWIGECIFLTSAPFSLDLCFLGLVSGLLLEPFSTSRPPFLMAISYEVMFLAGNTDVLNRVNEC